MTEVFHYPVKTTCACTTRVCQHCSTRIIACPTCRNPQTGSEVDDAFLQTLTLAVTGKTCDGCAKFIRSRRTIKHAQECPLLLALRLRETMDESLQKDKQYRKIIQHNETLAFQVTEMTYQLLSIRDRHRHILLRGPLAVVAPAEESDDEEEGEVIETFHVPTNPPTLV